jgi:hypothetical protein
VSAGHRWLLAISLAIIVTGLVGIATLQPTGDHRGSPAYQPGHPTGPDGPVPSGALSDRAARSPALATRLLGPADVRGFTLGSIGSADAELESAPCLLGLGPSSFQTGRAVTALSGPGPSRLPAVTEVAASYPAAAAAPVFGSVAAALQACPAFAVTVAGTRVVVSMNAASTPVVGDASRLYDGRFRINGRMEQLDVALVLDGDDVLGLLYVDTVPAAGGFVGTVRAAVAKLG